MFQPKFDETYFEKCQERIKMVLVHAKSAQAFEESQVIEIENILNCA